MSNDYFWSDDQKKNLAKAYSTGGLKAAEQLFPNKRRGTIATQASRLGLTKPRPRKGRR